MCARIVAHGLVAATLLWAGLNGAEAAAARPIPPDVLGTQAGASLLAMCGYSCRSGGRYIPGPPSVCYEAGLNFCGPSRRWEGPQPGYGYYGGYRPAPPPPPPHGGPPR